MNATQTRFLLAFIAAVNGSAQTFRLPRDKNDSYALLMDLDGGPKIYISRKNRQAYDVSAGGYAFHRRDAAACHYMIGVACDLGRHGEFPRAGWEEMIRHAKNIAEGKI